MTPRGGARVGAGRKPGSKNREQLEQEVRDAGITPLEYMLGVLRDEGAETRRRDDMAKAAARFVHPMFSAVEHTGAGGGPMVVEVMQFADTNTSEQLATAQASAEALALPAEWGNTSNRDSASKVGEG